MTTSDEMRAITATFTAQGWQETLPLAAAGYREVPAHAPKYKPVCNGYGGSNGGHVLHPENAPECPVHPDGTAAFLRRMTNRYGHCGQ